MRPEPHLHWNPSPIRGLLLACVVLFIVAAPALATPHLASVGFAELQVPNGAEPPLTVGVWYPVDGPPGVDGTVVLPDAPIAGAHHPLIVISHGGGGSLESHADTAIALARAGFVVAAPSHRGDTYDDQSQVLNIWRRPEQLRTVVTYMLETWAGRDRLAPDAVGAFGFSNGGFTVLIAAGAVPDLTRTGAYCKANPAHDLCQVLAQHGAAPGAAFKPPPAGEWAHDPRIKAVVVAAPAYGFAFDQAGLAAVRAPVQLWGGAEDRHQPPPWFEDAVRGGLPRAPEFHRVAGAGHYDFLPPCGDALARINPEICRDPPGFDRAAFHARFNADITRFFLQALSKP